MKWITAIVFSTSVPDPNFFPGSESSDPFPDVTDPVRTHLLAVSNKNNFLKYYIIGKKFS
jgi:hypothetical protein